MLRLCLVSLVFLLAGCSGGSGPPVVIIVPKGLTGPVWIVLDPDASEIPLVDGRYEVVIPADGILRVRSFRPFEQWHKSSARYDDGTPLPEADTGQSVAASTVALRGGGSAMTHRDGKEVRWMPYFVGTAKQYHERPESRSPPWLR